MAKVDVDENIFAEKAAGIAVMPTFQVRPACGTAPARPEDRGRRGMGTGACEARWQRGFTP